MPPTLYLLDGHALAYRAYFALTRGSGGFTTRDGEPTAGVFGFTSILLRLYEQDKPEYLAIAFDTGKTFRDEMYPEYKGTREKMPDDLRTQIERMRQLVDAFQIPRLEVDGYEADDVIGSAARLAVQEGFGVKIITGDRDLLQLVEDRVIVNLPGRSIAEAKDYRAADVLQYLGVRPDQVVDYKALMGDSSDNIPGVPGVGQKTAVGLLEKYDTLEGVYAHLDELSAGVRKKLIAGQESATLSRKLAQIVTDVPLSLNLEDALAGRFDREALAQLFQDLEFRSLQARLDSVEAAYQPGRRAVPSMGGQLSLFGDVPMPRGETGDSPLAGISHEIVATASALESLVATLNRAAWIAFDTETTSTDPMAADLVGISLAVDGEQGYYIPVGHQAASGAQIPLNDVIAALTAPLTNPAIPKAGHNLKYDAIMLARQGLDVKPLKFDTMIAEWLIDPLSRHLGLKALARTRLGYEMTEIESLIGKGKTQITMAEVAIEPAAAYAAADAAIVLRLMTQLQPELVKAQMDKLFDEIEMPLIPVLMAMEMAGIRVDSDFLAEMSDELMARIQEISEQVYRAVGEEFNLNSTQQLSSALFDRLQLTPPVRTRKTASGHYSTSAEVLEGLRGEHDVIDAVLEYRELSKLKSTYVDSLPLQVNVRTGRIHTSYSQTTAVTGRLSSSNPNLQNIPTRTELGQRVRKAFVAAPGQVLLAVDYSQVELRIVAHMSGDEAMLNAFRADEDIHATTAAAIYGVPLDQVDKAKRRAAKAINFGLIYGMSAFGLTRSSDLTLAESEDFVKAYFKQFPGVKGYLDGIKQLAVEQGYVETLLGRRRYFPELQYTNNVQIRNRAEREAINAPIQGTAADIMKIAMLRVSPGLRDAGLSAQVLLQVHDELVLECKPAELIETAQWVQQIMENAYTLAVPLKTDARSGLNWAELRPLD